MNEIPTAEEFLKSYNNHEHSKSDGCNCRWRDVVAMRLFAKLHVEAALRAITRERYDRLDIIDIDQLTEDLIKNTYPLTNIK